MKHHYNQFNPLERRPFRFKNAVHKFFCPLCRSERAISCSHRMSGQNYLQLALSSAVVSMALYPFMGLRSLFSFFVLWAGFELTIRYLFRKEIPCPYCGFDASWYKKDVKVARKLVDEFWQAQEASQVELEGDEVEQTQAI